MRSAFLNTLGELAEKDPRIFFVVGDLGFTVIEPFAKRFPSRFINAGVAEQNMTGFGSGLALDGKIVFTYSIANFPTLRCLEQIRNDACYHRANLKIVSVGGGLAYGSLGSSHHATEDIAVLRSLPEMTVFAPGDPVEAAFVTKAAAEIQGPCYLRLGKAGEPTVHPAGVRLEAGRCAKLSEGKDITIISTGAMLKPAFDAAESLRLKGVSVRQLSMHTIKPLDSSAVLAAAVETGAIVTVEEHSVLGGLGGGVAEILAQADVRKVPFRILGLPDAFCRTVGDQVHLRECFGLTAPEIEKNALALLDA